MKRRYEIPARLGLLNSEKSFWTGSQIGFNSGPRAYQVQFRVERYEKLFKITKVSHKNVSREILYEALLLLIINKQI